MSAAVLQRDLKAAIEQALPGLREVEVVEGEFTREVIAKARKSGPSVHLSAVLLKPSKPAQGRFTMQVAVVFLIVGLRGRYEKESFSAKHMALLICEQLASVIMGLPVVGRPVFRDLTNPDDKRQTNAVMLGEAEFEVVVGAAPEDAAALNTLLIGITPETGPDHVDDYVALGQPDA